MHRNEIDIITLGCSKNLVDAERLMRQLEDIGYRCIHDAEEPQGEIAIVNTCGFIGDAKEESIRTILQFIERKQQGQLRKLFVMGCLSERYLKELEGELPEVDKFYGKFDFMGITEDLRGIHPTATFERTLTTPNHYAYLKIAEGCNRFCSYCAIPLITGRYRSRSIEEIVEETKWLAARGVTELQVIAQDLTYYGRDLYGESRIAELAKRLSDTKGIRWIRFHYAYPTEFPTDLLPVMRERDNICNYLDIALQHCTDHMLSLMRRHISAAEQDALIAHIRAEVPDIHLRTTLIAGHPGETEDDFEALKEWVRKMRFERLGAFAYSDEEGTYANLHYTDDIPQETKEERVAQIMHIQEGITTEINAAKLGQTLTVVIDREEGEHYIGRTEYDSPEVDCEVLIAKVHTAEQPVIGAYYKVKITGTEPFDLYGTITEKA